MDTISLVFAIVYLVMSYPAGICEFVYLWIRAVAISNFQYSIVVPPKTKQSWYLSKCLSKHFYYDLHALLSFQKSVLPSVFCVTYLKEDI